MRSKLHKKLPLARSGFSEGLRSVGRPSIRPGKISSIRSAPPPGHPDRKPKPASLIGDSLRKNPGRFGTRDAASSTAMAYPLPKWPRRPSGDRLALTPILAAAAVFIPLLVVVGPSWHDSLSEAGASRPPTQVNDG